MDASLSVEVPFESNSELENSFDVDAQSKYTMSRTMFVQQIPLRKDPWTVDIPVQSSGNAALQSIPKLHLRF